MSAVRPSPEGIAIVFSSSILRSFAAAALFSAFATVSDTWADDGAPEPRIGVIQLQNGDHLTGTLVNSTAEDCLDWKSKVFATPFRFPTGGIVSVHFPAPATLPQAEGVYGFELAGGDLLFGSLIALDGENAILDIPGFGRLNVDRTIIRRLFRRTVAGEQLFVGPTGLNGWKTSGEVGAWREEAGHLIADKPGAVLWRDFGLPNQVRVEFELSWTTHPDFELAIGVGDDPKSVLRAFRFEVWESEIVVQRETEKEADVVRLQGVAGKSGRLNVQAFLDQKLGRMLVFSSGGEQLADLTVASSKSNVLGGIQLVNRKGDIRLERLQIGRWVGEAPRFVQVDKSRIHIVDGTIQYGTLKSFDAEKHEFVVGEGDESHRLAEDQVNDVFLSQSAEVVPRALRCVDLAGMKISGDLLRIEDQKVWLKTPGITEQIVVPLSALQSLIVLKPPSDPPELPQRRGRLEVAGMTLHGCLVDGTEGENSCLQWQPLRGSTSSPLQRGVTARIVYRDPPPPVQPQAAMNMQPGVVPGKVVKATTPKKFAKKSGSVLHLRTGDIVPCEPISVDEKGLTFKSTVTEATFVPHEQIKVLELLADASPVEIAKLKKERLLTLPRMQRDNPPTHLLRSIDGDYLRGQLVGMDEAQLHVELRLEGKIVRRDRIARVIWLHPENLAPNAKAQGAEAESPNLVQALPSDGNRLTFHPEQISGSTLSGKSDLLGICRVDLQNVDQLLIGAAIEQATAELAFHQWKLKPAAEPLVPKEGTDDGDSMEGQESVLIGKQAPDIQLKMLNGKSFKLADHKGKVVILDFWASWCGPCLQVMPQIDKVAEEFADQGVELFAVNLEETPEKIKAAQERLKLSTTVLLDRDGRIAERYGATSIPQTVIINRDGTVARLFVGASSRFDEQLRTALKGVLSGDATKNDEAAKKE